MKKLAALLCAGTVMAMMSGCGLTDPVSAPTVTIAAIGSINSGTTKHVTGKIEAGAAITSISYSITDATGAATTGATVTGPTANNSKTQEFTDSDPIVITATTAGDYKLVINVTANATGSGTFAFTITGVLPVLLPVKASDGKIENIAGPGMGAYDLVTSTRIASSGAASDKDLLDLSIAGDGFKGEIGSGNGSTFAAASATDYTNATAATVKTLATAATATKIAISSGAGTVFVVKLGSSRGYAIVKILSYDATAGGSTGNNKGVATFEYKFTAN
jgi:hypothetical protein